MADTERGVIPGPVWGSNYGPGKEGKAAAIRSGNLNLAQLGWQPEDGTEPPSILTKEQHGEFRNWTEFQLRYRAARAAGLSDCDAHSYAGRDPSKPELQSLVPAAPAGG